MSWRKSIALLLMVLSAVLGGVASGWGARVQLPSLNVALVVVSVAAYSIIGFACRTASQSEYFVASRRIDALTNGLATAADWMSAASFIALTGILMTLGFTGDGVQNGGLIYLLGWTGGFVILATVLAGKVNAYGVYSIPELLEKRFGGKAIRRVAAFGTVLCSGIYLVAQIYGIGLVTSLLSGMTFELGVFLALGGVLLCSFLGGMRAITWTQVVQCLVIVLVMVTVAIAASWKLYGHPLVPLAGAQALHTVEAKSVVIQQDPAEEQVQALLTTIARDADNRSLESRPRYDVSWLTPSAVRSQRTHTPEEIQANEKGEALERIRRPVGFVGHAQNTDLSTPSSSHTLVNALALVFCLMVGTASLPHIVVRSMTTPTPQDAKTSIVWAMVFVVLVYLCATCLAIMAKQVVLQDLVGAKYAELPTWANQLRFKKLGLLHLSDLNKDGVVQFAEIGFYSDYLVLGVPEVLGLPVVLLGLLAMGAMAAALSTADGLLLTISNALVHDGFYTRSRKEEHVDSLRKVMLSKMVLLLIALVATWIAAHKIVNIVSWISYAFSLAAATFFPVLILGLCWPKTTRRAALGAMVIGLSATGLYMVLGSGWAGVSLRVWGIEPTAGGVFGVFAGLLWGWLATVVQTWRTPQPVN
jgi:cation/acetate symporter